MRGSDFTTFAAARLKTIFALPHERALIGDLRCSETTHRIDDTDNWALVVRGINSRALGAGRRGPGEQGQRGDHQGPSQSHHRWPPSAVARRITVIFSYEPH